MLQYRPSLCYVLVAWDVTVQALALSDYRSATVEYGIGFNPAPV